MHVYWAEITIKTGKLFENKLIKFNFAENSTTIFTTINSSSHIFQSLNDKN